MCATFAESLSCPGNSLYVFAADRRQSRSWGSMQSTYPAYHHYIRHTHAMLVLFLVASRKAEKYPYIYWLSLSGVPVCVVTYVSDSEAVHAALGTMQ